MNRRNIIKKRLTLRELQQDFTYPKLHIPKITINGRTRPTAKKEWYVYYYFMHPELNTLKVWRVRDGINRLKTVRDRTIYGRELIEVVATLLESGFSPYKTKKEDYDIDSSSSLENVIKDALEQKRISVKANTYNSYRITVGVFLEWAKKNDISKRSIQEFDFDIALAFINYIRNKKSKGSVGTSIDNYRRTMSAIFAILKKDRMIPENYFSEIETKRSKPKKHKAFSNEDVIRIKNYLIKNDIHLYHFITVLLYTFLRNREVVSLKVGDIDLNRRVLALETKTESITYKLITDNVYNLFKNELRIQDKPKNHFIFTDQAFQTGINWNVTTKHKLRFFSEKFKRTKEALNLSDDHTLYSFRHTIISDVFGNLLKSGLSEQEAIFKLMSITGHNSETALRKYLREIGAILPHSAKDLHTYNF